MHRCRGLVIFQGPPEGGAYYIRVLPAVSTKDNNGKEGIHNLVISHLVSIS